MAAGEGALWVTNASDGTVSRIDLATNEVVATIEVAPPGEASVDAIAVGGGAVWVTALNSAQLMRIDPATNDVAARISLSAGVQELEYGGGALWGKASFANQIIRVDPATNTVVASIPVPQSPAAFAYMNDALWVQGQSEVSKIDPATNTIVTTLPYNDTFSGSTAISGGAMRAAGGSLWLSSSSLGAELVQIDPVSAAVVARAALPAHLDDFLIAGGPDAVFICPCFEDRGNMIWRLDLTTQELTAGLNVPDAYWIEYEAGSLWSYSRAKGVVTRIDLND